MLLRVVAALALLSLAGCSGTGAAPSGSAFPSHVAAQTTASSSSTSCPAIGTPEGFPHQANEIEAVLPAVVAGRTLTRWSVRGRCWLELLISDPAEIDPFAARFKT